MPIAGDVSVGDVAAQLSAVTNKANDPRLAGQSNIPAPQPEPVPVPTPVSAPLPEMPQMPQMPTPAPPQPSYNVKEDGYVHPVHDKIVEDKHIYWFYLSSRLNTLDSSLPDSQLQESKPSQFHLGRHMHVLQGTCSKDSTLSLGHLGQVLAKEEQYILSSTLISYLMIHIYFYKDSLLMCL